MNMDSEECIHTIRRKTL